MRGINLVIVSALLSCGSVTSPDIPDWMSHEWETAKCRVAHLNPPPNGLRDVTRRGLEIREEPGVFQCGEWLSNGCFHNGGPLIRYNVNAPGVMRHEFGHYILWRLHDPRGPEYEHHSDPSDPAYWTTMPQVNGECDGP